MRRKFRRQGQTLRVRAQVEAGRAGCLKPRKSTRGCIINQGRQLIKTWSLAQAVIALSSGEAEYYGMVTGASLSLGTQSLLDDLGIEVEVHVYTGSSAAKRIASRKELGRSGA